MKKLTALILTLCMLLSLFALTACGGGEGAPEESTPAGATKEPVQEETKEDKKENKKEESLYQTVAAAMEKTVNAKSYDADVDVQLKTDLMGYKSEKVLDLNVKAVGTTIRSTGKSTQEGYTMDQDFYYDGQWKYFKMDTTGYKMKATLEEFSKDAGTPQNILAALPEALFAGVKGTKNADGSITAALTMDEATAETLYKNAIVQIVYDVVGEDLNQATTKDAAVTVTVADGYIRDYKVSFTCEIVAGKDKVTYDSVQSVVFLSCDKDVTVPTPADLANYYEMDWG